MNNRQMVLHSFIFFQRHNDLRAITDRSFQSSCNNSYIFIVLNHEAAVVQKRQYPVQF